MISWQALKPSLLLHVCSDWLDHFVLNNSTNVMRYFLQSLSGSGSVLQICTFQLCVNNCTCFDRRSPKDTKRSWCQTLIGFPEINVGFSMCSSQPWSLGMWADSELCGSEVIQSCCHGAEKLKTSLESPYLVWNMHTHTHTYRVRSCCLSAEHCFWLWSTLESNLE